MSKNTNLHEAKRKMNDEWFSTKATLEVELIHYWNHFKGKIIYCNCDDPYESEFFKYFAVRFNHLGLKGLYASCYEGSQMSQHQLQLFEDEDYKGIPYKIELYQKDIDELLKEYDGTLSQETIKLYIKKHKKAKRLKGNGSFDSPECLKLLEKADIVVTNEPFSLTIPFINLLMEYNKKFLIIANKNAITYKEVFPLFKDNKLWLGYTQPKEFMTPTGEISKKLSGLTRWFTNLDIPKRHDNLILWKKYSPDEYPHYDNYDAINVDKVAEIPCDYCESWGLYPEEYEVLDKAQWEEVRREHKDDTELIYVIPAKNTELRQALHNHSEGYKEKIEAELANVIYCNGVLGVPITYVDKANSKQFEILEGDDYRKKKRTKNSWSRTSYHDSKESNLPSYPYQKDIVTELLELQSHSSISGVQNSLELKDSTDTSMIIQDMATVSESTTEKHTHESLSKRYCNGCIGVPITVLDKYNPEQLEIVKFRKGDDGKDLTYTTGVTHLSNKQQATSNKQQATSNKQQATSNKQAYYTLLQNSGPQDIVTESSECQSRSLTNGVLNNLELSQCQQCRDGQQTIGQCLMASQNIQESLSQRYCNGIMGVPVSFINYSNIGDYYVINHNSYKCKRRMTYQRLIIQRKL